MSDDNMEISSNDDDKMDIDYSFYEEQTPPPTSYRKKAIPATLKRLVWNRYIGESIGKHPCICCRVTDITQLSFHCGHVIAERNGGQTTIDNLRPICQNCNSSMGTMNMTDFVNIYGLHR